MKRVSSSSWEDSCFSTGEGRETEKEMFPNVRAAVNEDITHNQGMHYRICRRHCEELKNVTLRGSLSEETGNL